MTRPTPQPWWDPGVPDLVTLHAAADSLGVRPTVMRTRGGRGGREHTWGLVSARVGQRRVYRAADIAAVAAGQPPDGGPLPELATLTEAGRDLGLTADQVRLHHQRGRLPARDVGRALVVRAELVDYVAALVRVLRARTTVAEPDTIPTGLADNDRFRLWDMARRIQDQ